MQRLLLALLAFVVFTAQAPIPQPTQPVVFCGTQATPVADTYQVVIDGGTPQALTMDTTKDARCPAGATHSFRLPASHFTVGNHSVQVVARNAFGSTSGPSYAVTVGIAPGQFTIEAVVAGE